jgi:hypothetical protein
MGSQSAGPEPPIVWFLFVLQASLPCSSGSPGAHGRRRLGTAREDDSKDCPHQSVVATESDTLTCSGIIELQTGGIRNTKKV